MIEVGSSDVDWAGLSVLQQRAADGLLAAAMAGYVHWLAPVQHDEAGRLQGRFHVLRQAAANVASHRRTPVAVANQAIGLERFLEFAEVAGAITSEERGRLWQRGWRALIEVGEAQGEHVRSAEPVARFLELLRSALASGEAHLAAMSGASPHDAVSWGWRLRTLGVGEKEVVRWEPQGRRIGWLDGENLYLEPESAFAVCQRLGATIGEPLTVGARTVERRLAERGLLASIEEGRDRLRVRVSGLEGKRRAVLHILEGSLFPEPAQAAQAAQTGPTHGADGFSEGQAGSVGWASTNEYWARTGPANRPNGGHPEIDGDTYGPVGPVGPLPPEERIREWRG